MPIRLALLSMIACLYGCVQAAGADSCRNMPIDPNDPPSDGQMFVKINGRWSKFGSLADPGLQGKRSIEFVYVVRPIYGGDRTGVLVIKTNRPAKEADRDNSRNKIRLIRKDVMADPKCKPLASFRGGEALVSTRAYEDYHDYQANDTVALRGETDEESVQGKRSTEEDKIKAFHFEYQSERKRRCIRTDDNSYDEFPWNGNSNRAQFSFDKIVVDGGSYTGFRLLAFTPPSQFQGAAEHRTQMKKYATEAGMACVLFSLPVDSADYSIRINDLEGRPLPSSKSRTPEQRWYPNQ